MKLVGSLNSTPDTSRGAFLEEISREARRSLSVIIGYSEMLAEEIRDTNPDLVGDVDLIRQAGTYMVQLVNALEERVEQEGALASVDALTGVPNRRYLVTHGQAALKEARAKGEPLAVVMLDIDHFKKVNDSYGHAVGDEVLAAVAKRCTNALRDIDIFARYGGEEFVAVLPETTAQRAVEVIAERLRRSVAANPVGTEGGLVSVTLSLGVAMLADDTSDIEALISEADQAMYQAKRLGRNRVVFLETKELASAC